MRTFWVGERVTVVVDKVYGTVITVLLLPIGGGVLGWQNGNSLVVVDWINVLLFEVAAFHQSQHIFISFTQGIISIRTSVTKQLGNFISIFFNKRERERIFSF